MPQDPEYLAARSIMQKQEQEIARLQAQVEELQGDVSRLTIENDQVKTNFEHEMWCHAACLTLAEGNKDYPPIELQSLAMQKVIEVVQERDALKAQLGLNKTGEPVAAIETPVGQGVLTVDASSLIEDTAVIDEKPAKKPRTAK